MFLLVALACSPGPSGEDTGSASNPGDLAGALQKTAAVATVAEDWTVGALATVSLDQWTVSGALTTLSTDPALVVDGGEELDQRLVVLNRYNTDTVRIYELDAWETPLVEFALEDQSNPVDARICADKLFVSPNNGDALLVYDPVTGLLLGTVDLSAWDDGDGTPEPATMVELGGYLYVALNQLTQAGSFWLPAGGTVVEVDCDAEAVLRDWQVGNNPDIHPWPGADDRILVRTGAWFDADGNMFLDGDLTVLEPATDTLTHSEVTEETLGLSLMDVAVAANKEPGQPASRGVLVTADADWGYQAWCLDLDHWDLEPLMALPAFVPGVSANDRGEVWVAQLGAGGDAPSGIAVVDAWACEDSTGAQLVETPLPPYDIAFY